MNRLDKDMKRVLVVEDYEDVREMLKILLESEDFHVLEAATGAEALTAVKNGRPDVILMDLALPGFDGFETIRRVRKIDGFQNTPIIVLTAYNGRSTYETASRAGANFFMPKPIDFDELADLLKEILINRDSASHKYKRSAAHRAVIRSDTPTRNLKPEVRWTI
jgi:CheY-like chemotaxis protein